MSTSRNEFAYDAGDLPSGDSRGPSPSVVNQFHFNDDCDTSWRAHHHTIGTGLNQAASGKLLADLIATVAALEARVLDLETP